MIDRIQRATKADGTICRTALVSLAAASESLFFACAKKSNPKKAHPVGRARRVAPGPRVPRGFSTGHPCPVEKRAASCRAPDGPDPRNPSRPGAPVDQDQNRITNTFGTEKSLCFMENSWGYLRIRVVFRTRMASSVIRRKSRDLRAMPKPPIAGGACRRVENHAQAMRRASHA